MKPKELVPGVARGLSKRDLLRVVDAAYAQAADENAWVQGLLGACAQALDWGLGVKVSTFDLKDRPIVASFAETGGNGDLRQTLEDMQRNAPLIDLRRAYSSSLVSTLSDFLQCDLAGRPDVGPPLASIGARDIMGIVAFDPAGFGTVISPFLPSTGSLPASVRRAWLRVVTHLNAGLRLRRAPARTADAVLDAAGKVHDARGLALDKSARAALRQAARAIDRARSLRTSGALEALELHQAVIGGYWTLVDQFDADGRHFLVACRNPIGAAAPTSLSQREHQATALAAQGYSNKRIASALGLSTGSVSTLLYRASRKWGAGSRTRLIQEWQRRHSGRSAPERNAPASECSAAAAEPSGVGP